jgi:hypothetical protein
VPVHRTTPTISGQHRSDRTGQTPDHQPGTVYLQNNDIAPIEVGATPLAIDVAAGPLRTTVGVTPYAVDPESAQRLWELSEKLTA